MKVLVIDIGGTHIKVASTDHPVPLKIVSGPSLTAKQMTDDVLQATSGWQYDAITIGFPGPVVRDRPASEPHNLGSGWVGFPYQSTFPKPVRFLNDAAMQALGGYQGGKMLFLGVGTGLGSAFIVDGAVIPLELAHLPYRKGLTYEDYLGLAGLERRGRKAWRRSVKDVIERLRAAFVADYVLLGGGNAKLMKKLPEGVQLGANSNAIAGGIALWDARKSGEQVGAGSAATDKPVVQKAGKVGKSGVAAKADKAGKREAPLDVAAQRHRGKRKNKAKR